jgi:hypothetical protein
MLSRVVIVPQFRGDEDILAFDQPVGNGAADPLARFLFVLIVVCAVEEAVADFDRLEIEPQNAGTEDEVGRLTL